jgi:hypothetical protein
MTKHVRSMSTPVAVLLSVCGCLGEGGPADLATATQFTYSGDLGGRLGTPVTTDDTRGRTNDYQPTCITNSTAPDDAFVWTAPAAGRYTFDTLGSSFDTIIEVREYNTNASLGCNDDSGGTLQSKVTADLASGQTVMVVVDGYSSSSGTFRLNINQSLRHYLCGYALPGYGCDNGRRSMPTQAANLTDAISQCPGVQRTQLPGYTDFCYVLDLDGTASDDVASCPASWRAAKSCCNFFGTLSCPADAV